MMLETLELSTNFETLQKFEEISLEEENPPLKTMEIENPLSDCISLEEILGGSVNGETLVSSEHTEKFENSENKSVETESPSLDSLKPHEISGCSEIQLQEGGKIENQEEGEDLVVTQINKFLEKSVQVGNSGDSVVDIANSDENLSGSVKSEVGECSKTLDGSGDAQIEGENVGVDEQNITLKEFVKAENDDNVKSSDSSSDDEFNPGNNDYMLGLAMDPYVGNQSDCRCPHCLRKGEGNWRNIPNPLRVSRRSRSMHQARCEGMMFRNPFMRDSFCGCGNCALFGDRTLYRDHCRRYDRRMHFMPGIGGGFGPNVLHHWYNDTDSFYGNHYGIRNNKWVRNRFESESEREREPEPEPEPCPVGAGLRNLGNTCFLNSVMQCFTHTVVLVQGLLSLKHDTSSHDVGEFCVLCAVRDQIERSLAKSGRVISPSNLVDNLSNISSFFRRDQQEDAHEFLQALLDKLDCNWSKYEATAIDAVDPSSPSDSLVQQIFGGRFVSQICCCKCGHSSETPEPLLDLSLEIGEEDSLESALKSFTKVETLEGTNMFSCGNCKELVKAEKQLLLDNAPTVAALHLKRFKNDGVYIEKIDKMVEYPLELDLTPYTKGSNGENGDLKYELFAFVVHVGFSATSGHYFCYIRTSPEEWYRFDDSKVTRVPEDIALRQDAYILFYTKKGTPWFSTQIDKWKQECSEKLLSTSPKSVLHVMDLPSTSNTVGPSIPGCDRRSEDATCETSTAPPPSELRQDEVDPKDGVAMDLHGPSERDDSGDASVSPTRVESGEAEIADTRLTMEESGANKHETCSNTIGSVSGGTLGTPLHLAASSDNVSESNIGVEPSTPVRDQCPTKFYDGELAGGAYEIPRSHLKNKSKLSSSSPAKKSSTNASKLDMKRKEAAKLCKSMPGGRGALFMNLVSPLRNNMLNRKRKQGSIFHHRQSPKKRVKVGLTRV